MRAFRLTGLLLVPFWLLSCGQAQAQSTAAKLPRFPTESPWNARCDGVTDVSAQIQNAINAQGKDGKIIIPANCVGTYTNPNKIRIEDLRIAKPANSGERQNSLYLRTQMTSPPTHGPDSEFILSAWTEALMRLDLESNVSGPTNFHVAQLIRADGLNGLAATSLTSAQTQVGTVRLTVGDSRVFENSTAPWNRMTIDPNRVATQFWAPNTSYKIPGMMIVNVPNSGGCRGESVVCVYGLVSPGVSAPSGPGPNCSGAPSSTTCKDGTAVWRYLNNVGDNNAQEVVDVKVVDGTHVTATIAKTHPAGVPMLIDNRGGALGIGIEMSDVAGNTSAIFGINPNLTANSAAQEMVYEVYEADLTNSSGADGVDWIGAPGGAFLAGSNIFCGGANDCSVAQLISTFGGGGEWRTALAIDSVRRFGIAITNGGGGAPHTGIGIQAVGTYGIVIGSNPPNGQATNPGYSLLDPPAYVSPANPGGAAILLTSQGGCAACAVPNAPAEADSQWFRFEDRASNANHYTDVRVKSGGGIVVRRDGADQAGLLYPAQHRRFASPLGGTCPTAASVGAACTSAVLSWKAPFPDANYSLTCTLSAPTGQPHIVSYGNKRGTGFTLTIAADTAVAANAGADCIAMHD